MSSHIIESGQRLVLHLNASKCEVIASHETVISDPILQTFSFTPVAASVVFGAPVFPGPALDGAWTDHCAEMSRAKEKLSVISQDALTLLRASHPGCCISCVALRL